MKKRYGSSTHVSVICRALGYVGLFLLITGVHAYAQQNTVFLPYLANGYRFLAVKSNSLPQNFQSSTFNDSQWSTSKSAFGTLNNTSSPPCPLNDTAHVHTQWPSSRDILLRKHINLPAGTRNLKVSVEIDNAVQVFLNGTDVSGGIQTHNDCAGPGNYVFSVPDNLLLSGDNVIAVHGVWLSSKNYLDVQVTGDVPYTITASTGTNGTISPSGTVFVFSGASQTFNILPALGYHIANVLVDGVAQGAISSYTFTNVTSNHTISASFAINTYTLTVNATNGTVALNPATGPYNYGTSVTLTAAPITGYHFTGWSGDTSGTGGGTANPLTVVMNSDKNITANFAVNTYTLTVNATNGTVALSPPTGPYTYGTSVTLTATPNTGYHFTGWSGDTSGTGGGTANPLTVQMNSNKNITANFAINTFTIVATAGSHGSISPGGTVTVNYGASQSFALLPDGTYHVDSLYVDGVYVGPLTSYTFVNDTANHTISVTFLINNFTVSNTQDGRTGSLRDAILSANAHQGPDTIRFNIPAPGVQTISPASALPVVTDGVLIDGTSQTGYGGTPLIELSGNGAGQGVDGLTLNAGQCVVRGLLVDHFDGAGIVITGSGNVIGGTAPGSANVIASNGGAGVAVKRGNGSVPSANNAITANTIVSNGGLGIDLGGDGVTPNLVPKRPTPLPYPTTPDSINNAQNYPFLYMAVPESSVVRGSVVSWPNTLLRIEVFQNSGPDPSGYGQGANFVGSTTVRTDSLGSATFAFTPSSPLKAGQFLAATATDTANNTSEFSPDLLVGVKSKIYGNHYVVNTTLSGIPLHWPDGKGIYDISTNVPSNFAPIIDSSFATWSMLPQVKYSGGGSTTSTTWGGLPDGINNVVWVPNNWVGVTGADTNVIGVTRVRYNSLNGEMTDVDIAFNAQYFQFDNVTAPTTTVEDMQNVSTHEIGHFSGLGDIYNPGFAPYLPFMGTANDTVTMFGLIKKGETLKRALHTPDTAGIGYIYSHIPQYRVDLALVFDGTGNFASSSAYNGFVPSKNSAIELIQKLRVGDRVAVVQLPGTVVQPLTTIQDSASRAQVSNAIAGLAAGGTSDIRLGLLTGQSMLTTATQVPNHGRGMILFSAGDETVLPTALTDIPILRSSGIVMYTMGFSGDTTGQDLDSQLADSTGGAYYLAVDTTINKIVNSILNKVTGLQLTADTVIASNSPGISYQGGLSWQGQDGVSWQGQNGLSWQGTSDPGTTTLLPGLSWQGDGGATALAPITQGGSGVTQVAMAKSVTRPLTIAAGGQVSRFILGLVDPNNIRIDSTNFTSYPGAEYFQGPTFNYFKIDHPVPGKWTLWVFGDNSTSLGPAEPLALSLTALTDVTMGVSFNRANYVTGDSVLVQATLSQGGQAPGDEHTTGGGPITNATVVADVVLPGGNVQTMTFVHTGMGIYSSVFRNTSTIGSYHFSVRALGVIPATVDSFKRKCEQSVFVSAPFTANAVLFATNSTTINDTTNILSGSVIVNNVRTDTSATSNVELLVGKAVTTPFRYTLKASRISVLSGAQISSDVYYNQLTNAGTISGGQHSPLALPVVSSLPVFESATIGTKSLDLANGKTGTLAPGRYRDITLEPQSTLTLTSGGTYEMRTLWVKSNAKLLFTGPTHVRVLLGFSSENGSYTGPGNGSTIDASSIVIFVGGTNSQSPFSLSVTIGPQANVFANFYAPAGTLWLNDLTQATGAFLAKDLLIGKRVRVTLASSFTGLAKRELPPWAQAPADSLASSDLPTTFGLEQNYPNPFNPTTVIRYQLPEERRVRVDVYNILGQLVKTLVDEDEQAGHYTVTWDGTNSEGLKAGSGVYFYRMKAADFVESKKMLLLK